MEPLARAVRKSSGLNSESSELDRDGFRVTRPVAAEGVTIAFKATGGVFHVLLRLILQERDDATNATGQIPGLPRGSNSSYR
jgi:hypothetical protein